MDADCEGSGVGLTVAAIVVAAAAILLAALPAAVALRVLELPVGWVGAGLGSVGTAVFGVKLIAMAWAVGSRLSGALRAGAASAYAD